MIEITDDQIVDKVECCVYCGDLWNRQKHAIGCCGEVHFEDYYVLENGEYVLKNECVLVERELTEEQKLNKIQEDKYDFYKDEKE